MATPPPDKTRKKRGAPPVVTLRKRPARKKAAGANPRAIASNIMLFGAVALASYGVSDWLDRKFNCEPDPNNPDELICKHRDGSTSHRSRSVWRWSGASHDGASSAHGLSFGGFGHFGGGFHFGGG
jgi:hypothetical protein